MSKKKDKDKDKSDAGNPTVRKLWRALEWPGLLGWFGIIFAVASVWFFVSSIMLGEGASKLDVKSPDAVDGNAAADVAKSVSSLGFGDRSQIYIRNRLRRPLEGITRTQVHMAVAANARASWVFGAHALFVALFLWGLRLFDPAVRAEHEPPKPPKV